MHRSQAFQAKQALCSKQDRISNSPSSCGHFTTFWRKKAENLLAQVYGSELFILSVVNKIEQSTLREIAKKVRSDANRSASNLFIFNLHGRSWVNTSGIG